MYRFFGKFSAVLLVLWTAFFPFRSQAQVETYSYRFLTGDGGWTGMSVLQKATDHPHSEIAWTRNGSDSALSGIKFALHRAHEGDFLFVYKLFGGLQPNSVYRLSFLSSFTVADDTSGFGGPVHLKMGASGLRPRNLYGRTNFSKGRGAVSGKDLSYMGDMHWERDGKAYRYYAQNYDRPVYAATNNSGNIYLILGFEKGTGNGCIPPIYLNTLRVLFDYEGKDTSGMRQTFRIEMDETEEKNVYDYQVYPLQEVIRYSIYTREGHLVMVEEDSDCVPSCPNTIDASFLDPGRYMVEFVLQSEKRIIRPLVVRP